jgi:hypothetical protein
VVFFHDKYEQEQNFKIDVIFFFHVVTMLKYRRMDVRKPNPDVTEGTGTGHQELSHSHNQVFMHGSKFFVIFHEHF